MNDNKAYIAHKRASDGIEQSVAAHLREAREGSQKCAVKMDCGEAGGLIGLLHDFGKYSSAFQNYIKSAHNLINPDEDDYVDAKGMKGKIDHSTAGAQWVWQQLSKQAASQITEPQQIKLIQTAIQALAICIASHHSGLIDCLPGDNGKGFIARIHKAEKDSHFEECLQEADATVLNQANAIVQNGLLDALLNTVSAITQSQHNGLAVSELSQAFYLGMFTKFLFSGLIDADRISSADFETPDNRIHRSTGTPDWALASQRVEQFVSQLKVRNPIDGIRQQISNQCKQRAADEQGIYSLTVPTGGGKTYSSLRYAVHHAKKHQLDRIIYIIPYTSIIDQNATAIRDVLECKDDEHPWVLEHHSNLEPELQTWRSKLVCENWDAPVVLTTMVQFLETLFAGGTRGVRRLHQLANSVIVFDEIQTLPINCVHLFCNSINFLAAHCKTTAVMCTATQPLLNQLKQPENGQLHFADNHELMPDISDLFAQLTRVNIIDKTKIDGWNVDEISALATNETLCKNSCLVIVNTKAWAQQLFTVCKALLKGGETAIFHLSTSQCPAHRKLILDEVRSRLANDLPTLCISTQLIEAGVDVDFASVIRFMAGLDSIAQAAGRCNRNGHGDTAQVYVVNPAKESIDTLVDIKEGIKNTLRVFNEFKGQDILGPEVMKRYFDYYFFDRANQMSYPLKATTSQPADNLLNLLSLNPWHTASNSPLPLKQSFMTAGKAFKAIDAPTQSIIVKYGEGEQLLTQLCAASKDFDPQAYYQLLKPLQKYSVNVFPNVWRKLQEQGAAYELQNDRGEGDGIFYLDERFYSLDFGLTTEPCEQQQSYVC